MTDSNSDRKWFYRGLLLLIGAASSYLVLQPQYNFAHWIPHQSLRSMGVPYSAMLAAETHADKFLHALLGFALTILIQGSNFKLLQASIYRPLQLMCVIMLAAELAQLAIGRGFDIGDLLLGFAGSYLATLYSKQSKFG